MMTPNKRGKQQNSLIVFPRKISCHYYYVIIICLENSVIYTCTYSVSQTPLRFSEIFSQTVRNF